MDAELDPDSMPGFSAPACTRPGLVRHLVLVMPNDSAGIPDRGSSAKAYLEARGWRFGPWATLDNPSQVPYTHADATLGGYRLRIVFLKGQHTATAAAITPCFPGKPVTAPSAFPGSIPATP